MSSTKIVGGKAKKAMQAMKSMSSTKIDGGKAKKAMQAMKAMSSTKIDGGKAKQAMKTMKASTPMNATEGDTPIQAMSCKRAMKAIEAEEKKADCISPEGVQDLLDLLSVVEEDKSHIEEVDVEKWKKQRADYKKKEIEAELAAAMIPSFEELEACLA